MQRLKNAYGDKYDEDALHYAEQGTENFWGENEKKSKYLEIQKEQGTAVIESLLNKQ